MVEKVVIEVTGTDNLQPTIDDLQKLGAVDAKNAAQFKKNNADFQNGVKESSSAIKTHTDSLKNLIPVVTASFAVEKIVAFGKESVGAFLKAEDANKRLLNALKNNSAAFERLSKSAEDYQNTTVFNKGLITEAQTFLAVQGRTEAQINKVISAAVQLSTVTGKDLQTSVQELNATYSGTLTSIGRLDPEFKKLTKSELANGAAIDLVAEKYAGLAENELKTTSGGLKKLHNIFEGLQETIGEGIVAAGQGLIGTLDVLTLGVFDLTDANIGLADSEDGVGESFVKTRKEGELLGKELINGMIALKEFQLAQLNGGAGSDELRKSINELKESIAEVPVVAKEYGETIGDIEERISDLKDAQKSLLPGTQDLADNIADITKWENFLKDALGKTTEKIREQKKELEKPTKIDDSLGGTLDVTDFEAKEKQKQDLIQAGKDKEKEIAEAALKDQLAMDDLRDKYDQEASEKRIQRAEDEAQRKKDIEQRLIYATTQLITMALDYQMSLEQQSTDAKLQLIQTEFDAEKITQQQYNSQRRAILKDQAEKNKEAAIIKATISAALSTLKGFEDAGVVGAAIAAALGIAEIAIISATPIPQFEKGGKVKGKSHKEGGVKAELEGDEFIINKKAARKIGFDNLEMLNKGVIPPKLLKQGLSQQQSKSFENRLIKVLGSSHDFDTYPLERLLKKGIKQDKELTDTLVRVISGSTKKRGGY